MENSTKGMKVRIELAPREAQVLIFDTFSAAAKYIGCTKQLVSQCVRSNQPNKRAKGWTVQLVPAEETK